MHLWEFPSPLFVRLSIRYISHGFIFSTAEYMTYMCQLEELFLHFPAITDRRIGVEVKGS